LGWSAERLRTHIMAGKMFSVCVCVLNWALLALVVGPSVILLQKHICV